MKPTSITALSRQFGSVVMQVHTIKNGAWSTYRLGDVTDDRGAIYSLVLLPNQWYAAELDDRTDSYALVSTAASG